MSLMITFRKALLSDVFELNALVNSTYRGESSKEGWTTEAHLISGQRTDPERLQEMIESSHGHFELALKEEEIIGCLFISNEKRFVYFGMLAVTPVHQRKGLGSTLLRRGEKMGKSWGLTNSRMNVISEREDLKAYYERRGYRWNGETEPFPDHDSRHGLPVKKLMFHVYVKAL